MSYLATWHQGVAAPHKDEGTPIFHRSPPITFIFWDLSDCRASLGQHPSLHP